jgi:hypothetical protein
VERLLGLASGFGLLLILLGVFVTALSYQTISACLSCYSNDPVCWNPLLVGRFGSGPLGFYAGAVIIIIGVIMLAGPEVLRLLRERDAKAD